MTRRESHAAEYADIADRRGHSRREKPPRFSVKRKVSLPVVREPEHWRPKNRAECVDMPRPCPYVGCRYHLMIEVTEHGRIIFKDHDPTEMAETCALDVADRGESTLEAVGEVYGVTRERVRQIEESALRRVFRLRSGMLREFEHHETSRDDHWDELERRG